MPPGSSLMEIRASRRSTQAQTRAGHAACSKNTYVGLVRGPPWGAGASRQASRVSETVARGGRRSTHGKAPARCDAHPPRAAGIAAAASRRGRGCAVPGVRNASPAACVCTLCTWNTRDSAGDRRSHGQRTQGQLAAGLAWRMERDRSWAYNGCATGLRAAAHADLARAKGLRAAPASAQPQAQRAVDTAQWRRVPTIVLMPWASLPHRQQPT
jgi:hypothetical protein